MKSLFRPSDFQALAQRLGTLRPDSPRRWGRMTPHGGVCHLTDAFRMVLGERTRPTPTDGTKKSAGALMRNAARLYALTSPLPWPKGAPTSASVDQERNGTPPGVFEEDVAELQAAMGRFRDRDGQDLPPHILFGTLSRGEWGRWAYRHMDHHLGQFDA